MKTLHLSDPEKVKICWIKNTLFLDEMYCSEALLPEINANKNLEVIEDLLEFRFDNNNNLIKE